MNSFLYIQQSVPCHQRTPSPSAIALPDFGWRLINAEIMDMLSFIRGNHDDLAVAIQLPQSPPRSETIAK